MVGADGWCCCSSSDLEVSFHQKLQCVTEAEQRQQRAAVREVERQLRSHEASLVVNHNKQLRKAEELHLRTETRLQDQLEMMKVTNHETSPGPS